MQVVKHRIHSGWSCLHCQVAVRPDQHDKGFLPLAAPDTAMALPVTMSMRLW
jgi:hypothetical protein